MLRSSLDPKNKRLFPVPELSGNLIFEPFVSKNPPSCGDVSDTRSVLIPVRFDPSPYNVSAYKFLTLVDDEPMSTVLSASGIKCPSLRIAHLLVLFVWNIK